MAAGSTKLKQEVSRRKQLEKDLAKAKRKLKRARDELDSARARIADLEMRVRQIQQSPPYRFASRLWRLRARVGAPLRRRAGEVAGAGEEITETIWMSAERHDGQREEAPRGAISRAVTLLGVPSEERLAEALADLRRAGLAGSDLLVITDCDALRTLEDSGCRYEYVPPREDWQKLLGPDAGEYDDFLRRRLAMIGALHGVTVEHADAAGATS
jgi:hypothetical protein